MNVWGGDCEGMEAGRGVQGMGWRYARVGVGRSTIRVDDCAMVQSRVCVAEGQDWASGNRMERRGLGSSCGVWKRDLRC